MGRQVDLTLLQKLVQINWLLIVLITMALHCCYWWQSK
jgi:hypothetical protein